MRLIRMNPRACNHIIILIGQFHGLAAVIKRSADLHEKRHARFPGVPNHLMSVAVKIFKIKVAVSVSHAIAVKAVIAIEL